MSKSRNPNYIPNGARIVVGHIEIKVHFRMTTAPVAYDGMGTFHIKDVPQGVGKKDKRLVAIPENHLTWQEGRYASGMETCHVPPMNTEEWICEILIGKLMGHYDINGRLLSTSEKKAKMDAMSKATHEQVISWIGDDSMEELAQYLLDVINGDTSIETMQLDIKNYEQE